MENQSILDYSRVVLCGGFNLDYCDGYRRIYRLADFFTVFMKRDFPLKILHFYVLFSVMIFLTTGILKMAQVQAPQWVSSYLNDFLVIPIVGLICLRAVWWIKKDTFIRLHGITILSLVILYSVYFELYLPKVYKRYVADVWDVVCYAAGGVIFYVLQRRD